MSEADVRAKGNTARGKRQVDLGSVVRLLPTPSASNPNDGEDLANWQERRERVKEATGNGNGFGVPLAVAVRLLPTPTTGDAKSACNSTAGRTNPDSAHHDGTTLTDAVRLLPTPTSRDHKGRNQRDDESCLPGAVGRIGANTALPSTDTPASSAVPLPLQWTDEED